MLTAPSAVGVTAGTPLAEWLGGEGLETFAPWMFDVNGAAVALPGDAIGFRVRYWPEGARGIGELVEDDDGRPVFVPRNATPEEFRALVGCRPGRYKLASLDQSFRFLERVPLVVVSITRAAAERAAGSRRTEAPPVAGAASEALLAQVLALLGESLKQATAQNTALVVGLSDVLRAAGDSGTIQKTTALAAAAAGAPVTVHMTSPSAANVPPSSEAPRNASAPTAVAASAERGGIGEATMMLLAPLIEKVAPVLAYGAAKKMDMSDEIARDVAGFVGTTARAAGQMLRDDSATTVATAATTTATGAAVPREGADLMAHVLRIQGALSDDDRAWVSALMRSHGDLVGALKSSVAALTVDEGVRAVRAMRTLDAALTTPAERALFDGMLAVDVLPGVFRNLFVETATDAVIAFVRQRAAQG